MKQKVLFVNRLAYAFFFSTVFIWLSKSDVINVKTAMNKYRSASSLSETNLYQEQKGFIICEGSNLNKPLDGKFMPLWLYQSCYIKQWDFCWKRKFISVHSSVYANVASAELEHAYILLHTFLFQ